MDTVMQWKNVFVSRYQEFHRIVGISAINEVQRKMNDRTLHHHHLKLLANLQGRAIIIIFGQSKNILNGNSKTKSNNEK